MDDYKIDEIKKKKREFFIIAIVALIPLVMGVGYGIYLLATDFMMQMQRDGVILSVLSLIFSLFWGSIILLFVFIFWIAIFCNRSLVKLNDCYCKTIFPQAVARNPAYFFVKYTEPMSSLSEQTLINEKVIDRDTFVKQSRPEYFVGRYRDMDFEVTQLTLEFGKRHKMNGSVTVLDGFSSTFGENDIVQAACGIEGDVFAEYFPLARGWDIKQQTPTDNLRKVTITAPKEQKTSAEQLAFLEKLTLHIAQQTKWCFYIIFSGGKVYFILDGNSVIANLPLWNRVEKEIAAIEKSGILSVGLLVNALSGT